MPNRSKNQAKPAPNRKSVKDMTREERLSLIAFKNVMERKKKASKEAAPTEREYLTEAHKKNSEAAMAQIAKWQKQPITLEEALKKQREREK